MIKSVGIDLAISGEHKARCLDEKAEACDGFTFQTTSEGLAKLEERIFGDGSNPIIIFEPTGMAWLVMSVYLKARHPDCRLVRVQGRKVVALRKYLHRSSKSDKIDVKDIRTAFQKGRIGLMERKQVEVKDGLAEGDSVVLAATAASSVRQGTHRMNLGPKL